MAIATPWIRNLRLSATDAVFDGREAHAMRRLLGLDPSANDSVHRPSSLIEQASLAARLSHCGLLQEGLESAASLGLQDFGAAGLAVLNAQSLSDVEKALRNLAPLLNLRHEVSVRRTEQGLRLALSPLLPGCTLSAPYLQMLDTAKLLRFIDDLLDRQGLARQPKPPAQAWRQEPLLVPAELDRPFPRTNLREFRRHAKLAWNQMRELEHQHLANTVRRILIAGAGSGERLPDLPAVARELGYSQRTFRRRLRERGTSFMDCVNDVRHTLALRYLATTNYTVEVIAERLGYSDTANFRHAFRRWTGVSPSAHVARASADLPVTVMRTYRQEASYASP